MRGKGNPIMRKLAILMLAVTVAFAETKAQEPPITTVPGPTGDLLRKWWVEKTAAGNTGDWYDNRDEAHSDLDTKPYPQLSRFLYTPEDKKARANWAAARVIRPPVTFGNSSTSAPPTLGGSNPRQYYGSPKGISFLFEQYTKNNLYIYPEHKDYDPGQNGANDGYGDLYPTNTPYLLISQGSSYTDQPFMKAIPLTLAAFQPEVKKKLIETGLLMPTIQQIFRQSNKHLKSPEDYLTGKAHPPVFEGSGVDEEAMVKAAHALKIEEIAPFVSLKVVSEVVPEKGKDYFSTLVNEKLADTPCVIARVFLGKQKTRKMSVSAAGTRDPGNRPLKFTWVLLQGDPDRVRLKPEKKEGGECDIEVDWQPRRPIAPGSAMTSSRVDIGVFAHNGARYSAPSFITWFFLDNEDRVYDIKGNIQEISYLSGESSPEVSQWALFAAKAATSEGALALGLSEKSKSQLKNIAPMLEKRLAEQGKASDIHKTSQLALGKARELKVDAPIKSAEAEFAKAQIALQLSEKGVNELLDSKAVEPSLRLLAKDKLRHPPLPLNLKPDDKLACTGYGLSDPDSGPAKSPFEKERRDFMTQTVLARTLFADCITTSYRVHFVDQRLSPSLPWRDAYRYSTEGVLLGWTRFDGTKAVEFSNRGLIVEKKDEQGRCVLGRMVKYTQEPFLGRGPNNNPVQWKPTEEALRVSYGPNDPEEGVVLEKISLPLK